MRSGKPEALYLQDRETALRPRAEGVGRVYDQEQLMWTPRVPRSPSPT